MARSQPAPKRPAREVIDEAIGENRHGEWLLYGFSVITFVAGLVALGFGIYRNQAVTEIVGVAATALFHPAMSRARLIREQNMAIRLLEIPLNNAQTIQEASELLRRFFESTIPSRGVKPDDRTA